MRILELFSGTKSFSKIAEARGHKVFTVDIDSQFNPDLCIDIRDLNAMTIRELFGEPDVIWASPPCTEYSKAKSQGIRDIEGANKIVLKTLQLIKDLYPKFWILENPQTGLLKNQYFMKHIEFTDCSYCKYGMPYRKQTRFWNNIKLKLKICNNDCKFLVDGLKRKRHLGSAGCGGKGQGHKIVYTNKSYQKTEKYIVPKELCLEIIKKLEESQHIVQSTQQTLQGETKL